jgi:hypothetical protein
MKTLRKSLVILISIFVLSGCTAENTDTADSIARPENRTAPLQGTWKLEKCYSGKTGRQSSPEGVSKWVGTEIGFNSTEIVFGDKYWGNVAYKVRSVNAEEYFLHKYEDALKSFDIRDREVLVVTASSDDKFLYEFIKAGNDRYIVNVEDEYYCMVKTSDEFGGLPAVTAAKNSANLLDNSGAATGAVRSGLLLGFRVPASAEGGAAGQASGGYKYVTYWIASVNNTLRPVYAADNVFLPRKDGFWRLQIDKSLGSEGIEDILTATTVSNSNIKKRTPAANTGNLSKRIETKLEKSILYVGNDYVCVENTIHNKGQDSSGDYLVKVLRTLPVDNLKNTEGIRFSDLTGDNGIMAMEGAVSGVLGSSSSNAIKSGTEKYQEENFALFRKTGHWFFKGRISLARDDPMSYVDYNINLIPPPDMVAYDMLHVSWKAIKDSVPQAIDAYTSPNNDIAVVITRTDILPYTITNGALSAEPLGKYEIAEGSSVIMAEWATADYVQNWETAFMKNNDVKSVPEK